MQPYERLFVCQIAHSLLKPNKLSIQSRGLVPRVQNRGFRYISLVLKAILEELGLPDRTTMEATALIS